MDASNEPNKTENTGAAGNAAASPGLPSVDSPNLVPGQSEPANGRADAASAKATVIDHKVTTAVAIFKGESADNDLKAGATSWSARQLWSKFQIPPLAAAIVLTLGVGALAGALGALSVGQIAISSNDTQTTEAAGFRNALSQLSADVAALKAAQDTAARAAGNQLARMSERIERTERAQAEPSAKIAKISEALDKLERRVPVAGLPPATVAAAPAPTASAQPNAQADVTGSVPNAPQAVPGAAKDLARVPVIQGWVLQKVVDGTAIIQSREGMIEVGVGDALPGGGRVEAIRRQDGRWVVLTSRGLVVMR
jgi:hypothetical protein